MRPPPLATLDTVRGRDDRKRFRRSSKGRACDNNLGEHGEGEEPVALDRRPLGKVGRDDLAEGVSLRRVVKEESTGVWS